MPQSKALKTILLPKVNTFRAHLPRGSKFLGVSIALNPTPGANSPDHWDSDDLPVLHYSHDVHETEGNYHTFFIYAAESVTDPIPLYYVATFTVRVWGSPFVFHLFEAPDNQRPPEPATTSTMPAQSLPPHPPGSGPAAGSPPEPSPP